MFEIPIPVQFNRWKHHAGYIREKIKSTELASFDSLINEIKITGDGLMDLYLGELFPEEICGIILSQLGTYINRSEYIQWVKLNPQNFRLIIIDDSSKWVLRLGDTEERYIHIHPARYSPLTIRVKAPTLKSAIIVSVYSRLYNEAADVNLINKVRKSMLNLSPVKDISTIHALTKLINVFSERNTTDS